MEGTKYPDDLVFGLDIGTRSIVGTVGYREHSRKFRVIAHVAKGHETRAMLDGQIHDISKVSETIGLVKRELEQKIGRRLNDVCIAAAGRVLRTIQIEAEYEFPEETVVTEEHIYSLNMLGVEKAYEIIREQTKKANEDTNFYCVGYTVIRYSMNDNWIINLEGHKASKIKTELLATFLPNEVIDGLYRSVERAGLYVANLTLEPIAAINVAIPEKFRLLNIALIDVGAGTSDICITKDGSIIAYGMIPLAGDELTEILAREYLTDFAMAETIKVACSTKDSVEFQDIMGLTYELDTKEVVEKINPTIDTITKSIADKIIELNGGKSVSAAFIVGGGGKIPGFSDALAKHLDIAKERVALRGKEVLYDVEFAEEVEKDPLIVTPIGICLNYYEQKNNFIFVTVNGERIKLYDNDRLTIVDAAIQMGIQNEYLFPRRGKEINFIVDGKQRFVRGSLGEAAVVTLNGRTIGINSEIVSNDVIEIEFSTIGEDASCEIRQLPEFSGTISFYFNEIKIVCPKFVTVNDELVSEYYSIQEGDQINILNYYTLQQVLDFMDLSYEGTIWVNHVPASLDEYIYDNFSIQSEIAGTEHNLDTKQEVETSIKEEVKQISKDITVTVNGSKVVLSNKHNYILVDVLDFYPFNTKEAKGSKLITKINQETADFTYPIQEGDEIEIYWVD